MYLLYFHAVDEYQHQRSEGQTQNVKSHNDIKLYCIRYDDVEMMTHCMMRLALTTLCSAASLFMP
jgi:hypothetical protein